MKARRALSTVLFVVLFAIAASGAEINGQWKAEYTIPDGSTRQSTFTFKQDGEKLTGTVAGARGEAEIQEGKVSGDEISFSVIRNFGGNEVKLTYKGKVAGDEIKFKISFEGADREFEMTAKKIS